METGLIRYDKMCQAIAEAHKVDEVKNIRDKAMALERYAQQAMNMEAERKACEIRLRAERRAGELLREMANSGERATRGGDRKSNSHDGSLKLADLGISDNQSSRWQKLAMVPPDEFEAALRDPEKKPTTAGLLRITKANGSTTPMDNDALWLWGRLRDFERMAMAGKAHYLLEEMTDTMISDVARIAPVFRDFLEELTNESAQ